MPRLASEPLPGDAPPLVVIATDGELYGHHQPFRDLFLARLVGRDGAAATCRYATSTLAEAVERAAGRRPARRDPSASGRRGAATTASLRWGASAAACPDGRGRARSGARSTGSPAASTPPPSTSLRDAAGRPDPWAARDAYVDVVLGVGDRRPRSRGAGWRRPPPSADRATFAAVMEAQRWRLAMFACCGWFWEEPARSRPRRLRAAARAARLVDGLAGTALEHRLVDDLALVSTDGIGRARCGPGGGRGAASLRTAHVAQARTIATSMTLMPMSRRLFLAELGRGTVAIAVVGIAGCAPSGSEASGDAPRAAHPRDAPTASSGVSRRRRRMRRPPAGDGVTWERVNLGFVSAYVLARAGEAAVVDTGTAGSEDDIAAALERIGLGWDAVGHVIVTHKHGDHMGSLAAVLDAAPDATGYAGAEDLAAMSAPRPLIGRGRRR